MGLLLGADLPARRRIHADVFVSPRYAQARSGSGDEDNDRRDDPGGGHRRRGGPVQGRRRRFRPADGGRPSGRGHGAGIRGVDYARSACFRTGTPAGIRKTTHRCRHRGRGGPDCRRDPQRAPARAPVRPPRVMRASTAFPAADNQLLGGAWMLSIHGTFSGFGSTFGRSRFTTTGSWPLRHSTQDSGSVSLALISWWGTNGGT